MTPETSTALTVAEPVKPTLWGLLSALKAVDDEMIEINLDEQIDLIENGKVKVDSYKYVLDKLEVQSIYLKKREEEVEKARKAIEANIKRIKEHLIKSLRENGFDKFTGNEYVVKLQRAAPAVEIKAEPTAALKIRYPDLIRTKYEWDKTAVKDRLKEGDPAVAELAGVRETFYAKFSLVKD